MRHKTSIIILSYNTLEMLQLCIASIREYTAAGTYEIIVVENASKDGSAEWLKGQSGLRCIYNEENQGFPKGCNQGLEIAAGTELLLLNSDTIVAENWLHNLRCALYSDAKIGAVSCVTNHCSNNQQIEVPYRTLEEMQAFAANYNVSNPVLWERRTTLVGFCYLFKREVFEKVGFLDEQFSPGNFEDDDYSLRILQKGYDLLVCRDTFIHHFGHASFLNGYGEQEAAEKARRSNALIERNSALLLQKWRIPTTYKVMNPEELRPLLQRQAEPNLGEGITVGKGTHIHETVRCRFLAPRFAGEPHIVVGDHAEIGAGSTLTAAQCIAIGNAVSIAENVHIKDYVLDESGVGLSCADCEVIAGESGVHIERGVRIEENVLIRGSVRIGRGSLVRAGSLVQTDIPAYCIAEGRPARITSVFSPQAGKWLPAAGGKMLKRLLSEREKTPPLLTYAFITYNRSRYLKKSLRCVLQQIGNDELTEILVSDNASTDDTRAFVEEMQKTYKNLRYHCNEENVGAEGNIHRAIEKSRGEYVLVAGDDDYFIDGALHVVLNNIVRYRGVGLFYLGNENIPLRVYEGKGSSDWLRLVSYYMAWITSVVMRRELYAQIPKPHRYDDTRLPQVYLELEMLKQRPKFAVLHGAFFADESGDHSPKGYNFAEVFIKNYFDILTATVEILPAQLSAEKKWVMEKSILPWCRRIKENGLELSLDGIFDIVREYYGEEPYYPQIVESLESILRGVR